MKFIFLSIALLSTIILTYCSGDDDTNSIPNVETDTLSDDDVNSIPDDEIDTIGNVETNTFRVTLKNAINYLNVKQIGTEPLTETGAYYEVNFKATQGTYLSFSNMFAQSNDWIFATEDTGIKLWDGDTPKTGDISDYVRVFDAGSVYSHQGNQSPFFTNGEAVMTD